MSAAEAIQSQRVVTPEGIRPARVLYEDGKILEVTSIGSTADSSRLIDAKDAYVLPGLVDSHVHINDPGRTDWEGFATASRAAAAGGYTCLIDMPLNSVPATTDVPGLEAKRRAAEGVSLVDYAFWGGAVAGNASALLPLADAGVRGFKAFLVHPGIEEFSMVGEADLRLAMPLIAQTELPLLVHAEHPDVIRSAQIDSPAGAAAVREYQSYLRSRPPAAETEAIRLLVRLCREYRCHIHIVHLSAAEALPDIVEARSQGLPLTVETCPHYLYFAAENIDSGATHYKCAPPIREASNRELLWDALSRGDIDLVATDHSPCPPSMKLPEEGDFFRAWGGIASLSVAFSAFWTTARERGFSISQVVEWMSAAPAKLAGLDAKKGSLQAGRDADFVVFDPDAEWEVKPNDLHFRHPVSPYLGEQLRGKVRMTVLRGQRVFEDGWFSDHAIGREPLRHQTTRV